MARTLYRALLGPDFDRLPLAIREMHDHTREARGRADIVNGTSPLARLICRLSRLPKTGRNVEVITKFETISGGERWTRIFNGQAFHTDMLIDKNAKHPCVFERFGPFKFRLAFVSSPEGNDLIPESVTLFGLPLPKFLCPEAVGRERVKEGVYHFDVAVRMPLVGEIVRYDGLIEPVA